MRTFKFSFSADQTRAYLTIEGNEYGLGMDGLEAAALKRIVDTMPASHLQQALGQFYDCAAKKAA